MTRITYLEDSLRADSKGVLRDHLLEKLYRAEQGLRKQLCLPHSPVVFQKLDQCALACNSAVQLIEILWGRYHPSAHALCYVRHL